MNAQSPPIEQYRTAAPSIAPAPPRLSRNIIANFVGMLWTGLMGPALVSVYVRFLGIEAYGLVGILTTLQLVFTLLDLGLSATANRELARLSTQVDKAEDSRNLVRTLECLYWLIAGGIAAIVVLLAPLLTHHWVHAQALSPATIQQAFLIMGGILAFQFPFALYSGGLLGLQKQVPLSGILIVTATLRGGGTILLLWLVSPSVLLFFAWQLVITILQTALSAMYLWRSLPLASAKPRFQRSLLRVVWRFAAGVMGISFFALLLTQTDKIILSRLLTLEKFGYYSLATVVASSLLVIVAPIFTAIFPRFSQLIATDDRTTLPHLYHRSCQLMAVTMLPVAIMLVLFSSELLEIWTRNSIVVRNTHLLVSLLTIGTALNGLMNVPYALQLAAGWTKLALYQNMVSSALLIPLLFWATGRYGAVGAAVIWITVNLGYVLIGVQIMHTRLLHGEKRAWYVQDVGLPLAGALSVALIGRWLFPAHASLPVALAMVLCIALSTVVAAAIVTPLTREWLQRYSILSRFVPGRQTH